MTDDSNIARGLVDTTGSLPTALRDAVEAWRAKHPPRPAAAPTGASGEVCVVAAPGVTRLVVVVDDNRLEDRRRWHNVMLLSNLTEYATDHDLILPQDPDVFLPYSVMIQSEVYGPVWHNMLHGCVGTIPSGLVKAAWRATRTDGASIQRAVWDDAGQSIGLRTGLPLAPDPYDPRRKFKESELWDLNTLSSQVRQTLVTQTL